MLCAVDYMQSITEKAHVCAFSSQLRWESCQTEVPVTRNGNHQEGAESEVDMFWADQYIFIPVVL